MKAPVSIFEYEDFITIQRSVKGLRYSNGWFIVPPAGWKKIESLIKENRSITPAARARYLLALAVSSRISALEKKKDSEGILRTASILLEHFPKASIKILEKYGATISKS